MGKVETILSSAEKQRWLVFCRSVGKSSAKILREFIQKSLLSVSGDLKPAVKQLKSRKITVSFTQDECDAICLRTADEGYRNPTDWVRCGIMYRLSQKPVLSDKEIACVKSLSYQLCAIGRNLNQITKVLNHDVLRHHKLKKNMLDMLHKKIDESQNAFSQLISRNNTRWSDV